MFKAFAIAFMMIGTFAQLQGQSQSAPAQAGSEAVPAQAEKVMDIRGSVKPPTVISAAHPRLDTPAPTYKPGKRTKFEGNVLVSLIVDKDGNPTQVRVARSCEHEDLDEKAVEAVSLYKFKPATNHGKPVAVNLMIQVDFQIF